LLYFAQKSPVRLDAYAAPRYLDGAGK